MFFIVIGDRCWGKGSTPNKAKKEAQNVGGKEGVRNYRVFLVSKDSFVTGMGDIQFPSKEGKPIQLYNVINNVQIPIK